MQKISNLPELTVVLQCDDWILPWNQCLRVADQVIDAVKSGAIRHFFLVAGCDGMQEADVTIILIS